MGHDVRNIFHHNLNTSSLEALAKDLSVRFKANILFGVYDTFFFDWDGFYREASFDLWIFGKIEYPESDKTLCLTDEHYSYHIVYSRYGDDAYNLPYFAGNESRQQELLISTNNVSFDFSNYNEKFEYGVIFNDTFHNWYVYYYNRWWSFCRAFTNDIDAEILLDSVNTYRKKVFDFICIIGGDEAVYLDDQGKTQYLTENNFNWIEILEELKVYFKDTTLNVSEFMREKSLLPKEHYPLAFYDDFEDFKNSIKE